MSSLSCLLWNVRSICNKPDQVMQALDDADIDIAFITETWLSDNSGNITYIIKNYGFDICHTDRGSRGGGIAVIHRNIGCTTLVVPQHVSTSINSFEYHVIRLKSTYETYCIVCLYRKQEIPVCDFINEVDTLLEYVTNNLTEAIIVLGDFNVHFDIVKKSTKDVVDVFSSYGLQPSIQEPTHIEGHTIDQIFYNRNDFDSSLKLTVCTDLILSDHYAVYFTIPCSMHNKPYNSVEIKHFRKLKQVNSKAFRQTVLHNLVPWNAMRSNLDTFSHLCSGFKEALQSSLDQHAPLFTKRVTSQPTINPHWFDDEYLQARRKRRSLERRYKRNKTAHNKHLLSAQRDHCYDLVERKRDTHTQHIINQCRGNQRELFKSIPKLLDKQKIKVLPDHKGNPRQLAEDFNSFYIEKVAQTREAIKSVHQVSQTPAPVENSQNMSELHNFYPATQKEISDIISDMTIKTSPADPVPALLLKEIIEDLIPHIQIIVNASLSTGSMEGLKESIITPILKKHNLDADLLKNYRPISNIEFLSKIIEKVVLARLNEHMDRNILHTPEQFGYKKGHSTEHVVLEIVDEVLVGFDKRTATLVILLDLSAAFDTVDLKKLMQTLEDEIYIKGTALSWFHSFLFGRHQKVMIGSSFSGLLETLFGVPQGSVLGPVLFNIYIRNLPNFIQSFGFISSTYADDTNARLQFSLKFQYYNITQRLPELLKKISSWMSQHFLKLNPNKTEVIIFTPDGSEKINGLVHPDIGCLRFNNCVTLLGVDLDESLSFESHVSELVSSCYFQIRNIGKIKNRLPSEDLQILVHSVISSKLDYCNVILFGIKQNFIQKLQKVQNAAARLIYKLPKYSSVSHAIRELHWLRVDQRIVYKILLIVYKHFSCISPGYLNNLLEIVNVETRTLKLNHYTSKYGRRAFSYVAPRFWNRLPQCLRTETSLDVFKKKLKHIMFNNIGNIMETINMYRN